MAYRLSNGKWGYSDTRVTGGQLVPRKASPDSPFLLPSEQADTDLVVLFDVDRSFFR